MMRRLVLHCAKIIQDEIGIQYNAENIYQLESRIAEVIKICNLNEDQVTKMIVNGMELTPLFRQVLIDVATNNETSFFRDIKCFQSIQNKILPEILKRLRPEESLKVWSAASSYGQEASSLAILFFEALSEAKAHNFEILGTDISQRVLEKAQTGRYTQLEVQRGLDPRRLVRYFKKDSEDYWTFDPGLLKKIRYRKQNLLENFPSNFQFHLVLCRNVLIYQTPEKKADILKRMIRTIIPGGYLILGSGEAPLGIEKDCETEIFDGSVCYKIKG
ncbi:MAG: CheR family methyltransferase [Bdellovibrio sp.]